MNTLKSCIFCDIQTAIDGKANYLAALGLSTYTENLSGLRYGDLEKNMGTHYINFIAVGIISEESVAAQRKPSVLSCARCNLINALDNKFCSKCSYPLSPQAYEEIKAQEDTKLREMEEKQKQDIEKIREEMTQ